MPSSGHLGLLYEHNERLHECYVRVLLGVNVLNYTAMAAEADLFAEALKGVLPSNATILGWRTKSNTGLRLLDIGFSAPLVGTKAPDTSGRDFASYTATLTGKEYTVSASGKAGQALCRFYLGNTLDPFEGVKYLPLSHFPEWQNLAAYLVTSTVVWAGFNGYKAGVRSSVPIQFNAAVQRRYGS